MNRIAIALVAVAAMAAPAAAENLNCEKDYKAFWERMMSSGSKLSAGELATINRVAVRGYDACTAGDERFDAKNFFEKLTGQYGSKTPLEVLRDMESSGAKK